MVMLMGFCGSGGVGGWEFWENRSSGTLKKEDCKEEEEEFPCVGRLEREEGMSDIAAVPEEVCVVSCVGGDGGGSAGEWEGFGLVSFLFLFRKDDTILLRVGF